jgi:hypothetical protein
MTRPLFSVLMLTITGCGPDYGVEVNEGGLTDGSSQDTIDEDGFDNANDDEVPPEEDDGLSEEEIAAFEGAMIHIIHPESGDFLAYGDTHDFEAVIETPDGELLDFDEVDWTSDIDNAWAPIGGRFDDDSIDVGSHNISAVAVLPDGSRVAHTVGGVLVQHEAAGTYVGDMIISLDMEYGGTPVGTSCIGSALVVVDAYGEIAEGESACTLDLLGYITFEIDHSFEYDLDEDTLDGNAFVNIPFLGVGLPFPSEGGIGDGDIETNWEGTFGGVANIAGTLEVSRITREITAL